MGEEGEPHRGQGEQSRLQPFELSEDLAKFLATQPVACLMHETNQGTAHVIKLLSEEIASVQGRVPILARHELYAHPKAPGIRTVLTIYDQPERPQALETMTNTAEPDQRADFARLAKQQELLLLFYDERLQHRLTKKVGNAEPETIEESLDERCDASQA